MVFVTLIYFLATLIVGGSQLITGQTAAGLSFIAAGLFGFWAGSSLKLAIFAPEMRPRLVGLLLAASCTALGLLATYVTGVRFEAFGQDLHGAAWVIAGLLAGIMGTKRRRYILPPEADQV